MDDQVFTTEGMIDRDRLEVRDVVNDTYGARAIATEWYLEGRLVRRDVAVSILNPGSVN